MADAKLTVRFDGDLAALERKLAAARAAVRSAGGDETRVRATVAQSVQHYMRQETATFREQAATRVRLAEESARGVIRAERSVLAAMRATREMAMAGGGIRPRGWDGDGIGRVSAASARLAGAGSGVGGGGLAALGFNPATLVASATLFAAARGLRNLANEADNAAKAAKRLGLPVEELQRLAYAGSLSGATIEELEVGLRTLQRRVADTAPATRAAFAGIGLEIGALRAMAPALLFDTVGRAVAAIEDPTRRAAAAMDLYGRSGTALLPMLAELDKLKAAAPVIPAAAVAGMEAFNDAVESAQARLKSFFGESIGGWMIMGGAAARAAGEVRRAYNAVYGPGAADSAGMPSTPGAAAGISTEAAATAAAAAAAKVQRAQERAEFAAQMEHRRKLAALAGREPDRVAERALALGLPGVEGLGGGDRARGLEVLAAQEQAYARRLADRAHAEQEAARAAAQAAEAQRQAAESRTEAEARLAREIEDLGADATQRRRLELERQLADYAAAGVAEEKLAELRAARLAEIEREAAADAAREAAAAARQSASSYRSGSTGGDSAVLFDDRPAWAVEQARLRPDTRRSVPGLAERLEAARSGLGRGGAAIASAERTERMDAARIGRRPGAAAGPWAETAVGSAAASVAAGTRAGTGLDLLGGKLDVLAGKLDSIVTEIRAGGLV